uniref:Uncharacterized protein n=1 Tax=Arundo donax TaxID=35708 RepID=A0A0A9BLI5_ARUDO
MNQRPKRSSTIKTTDDERNYTKVKINA